MEDEQLMPLLDQFVTVILPIKNKVSLSFQGKLNKSIHKPARWWLGGAPSLLFYVADVDAVQSENEASIIRLK